MPVQTDSRYDDLAIIAAEVARGAHREAVGGLWEHVGVLQRDFLVSNGLGRGDRLLDVGCGSLRGGVPFIEYLEPAHYWGVDSSAALLDAGYDVELRLAGLQEKLPRVQLLCDSEFDFSTLPGGFDAAIAQSLFTHLSANRIRLCLNNLAAVVRPGGRVFATYFEAPEDHALGAPLTHPRGVTTFGHKDPFHYRISDLERLIVDLPFRMVWVGDWNHPRDQKMAILERLPHATDASEKAAAAVRSLPVHAVAGFHAGEAHYRSYVGPPGRFDFMGASQFALLFALGLRDHDKVLDFGCGSLRLGRLLIPFLQEGRYFGIDPNRWLIEDGFSRELGWSVVSVKRPRFAYNDDFRCEVFGETFDFVVAQSILTHCGRALAQTLIGEMGQALTPSGVAVFSVIEAGPEENDSEEEGWIYPHCVGYRGDTVLRWCAEAGLSAVRLPWRHPGAVWYAAAGRRERLPGLDQMPALSGQVMERLAEEGVEASGV